MTDKLIPIGFRILEVMFFIGGIGCVLTVIVAWVEIFTEGLSEDQVNDK